MRREKRSAVKTFAALVRAEFGLETNGIGARTGKRGTDDADPGRSLVLLYLPGGGADGRKSGPPRLNCYRTFLVPSSTSGNARPPTPSDPNATNTPSFLVPRSLVHPFGQDPPLKQKKARASLYAHLARGCSPSLPPPRPRRSPLAFSLPSSVPSPLSSSPPPPSASLLPALGRSVKVRSVKISPGGRPRRPSPLLAREPGLL